LQRSIYLINPAEAAPGYHSLEVLEAWSIARMVNTADLTMPTVAALVPDGWDVTVCDERAQPVNFNTPAAVIGLTGKVSQRKRMMELAAEFRRRGKLVVMGGPHASLSPNDLRGHTDILVTGELEEIAGKLFSDIAEDRWQPHYEGGRPSLATSPVPRWDLYPRSLAITGQVQTSRGCPFECEFCDVIQYLGRKQRWKSPDQVIAELDVLYRAGYRSVLFADDNFTVMRRRTRELLERIIAWNNVRPDGRMRFSTQVSVDLARDPELMAQCAEAGLSMIFVGIETPNQDSLAETMKRQNLRVDLAAEIRRLVEAGMMVMAGLIVGFDHDGPDIFDRQAAFVASLPVPAIQLGSLIAPAATPLFARLQKEGRLLNLNSADGAGMFTSNIQPKLMTVAQRNAGIRWLMNRIYSPAAYGSRVQAFVDASKTRRAARRASILTGIQGQMAQRLARGGAAERALVERLEGLAMLRPDLHGPLSYMLVFYCQVRFIMESSGQWDPGLGQRELELAS
jgi:hypothetical protein